MDIVIEVPYVKSHTTSVQIGRACKEKTRIHQVTCVHSSKWGNQVIKKAIGGEQYGLQYFLRSFYVCPIHLSNLSIYGTTYI